MQQHAQHDGKKPLSPQVVDSLISFKSYDNMRKLICEIISFTLVPEQINSLRKEFECADSEGTGEITLEGLKQILGVSAAAGNMGALTEDEVTQIFNSLKINQTALAIHYHEFEDCAHDDSGARPEDAHEDEERH